MVMGPNSFLVVFASLLALFSSVMGFAKSCSDDDRYTLYFYTDSDAKVLHEQQRCPDSTNTSNGELGKTPSGALVGQTECRCYEMKYQDVLKKLGEGTSPVAVSTKKLSMVLDGVTCRTALDECEKACRESQRSTASSQCQPINVAGIAAQ